MSNNVVNEAFSSDFTEKITVYAITRRSNGDPKIGMMLWFVATEVEAVAICEFSLQLDPVYFNSDEGRLTYCRIITTPAALVVLQIIKQQMNKSSN